jgi:hypothetical protein
MVVVPPPFEAVRKRASSSDTEHFCSISYPFNGGAPCIPTDDFKMPLTSPFHKSILIRLSPTPTLLKE